jgi:hypothetical protein
MTGKTTGKNTFETRDAWLHAAEIELRPYFAECGFPLPEKIRYAIAFPSTGRQGRRVGECWHSSASADGFHEIIIRADIAEPVEVLGVLVHELIHAALPVDAGHGPKYREAALKIGLQGAMRHAMPGQLLTPKLEAIAANLGPLPHGKLNIGDFNRDGTRPADRKKKQRARLLKAECEGEECGYTVRITAMWVDKLGAPHCPKHGVMSVNRGETVEGEAETESV